MGVFGRRHAEPAHDLAVTTAAPASPGKSNLSQVQLPPRSVQATMPAAGVACVSMETEVDMPADLMFTLLADPKEHERIFDAIEGASFKLLQEKGPWRRYELDYLARWKFWKVSGVCENKLFMETDADKGTVNFKLREPGFLRVYEGTWCIVPAGAQQLNMHSNRHATPQQQPAAGLALSAAGSGLGQQQQQQTLLQTCSAQAAASQQQQPWTWSSLFTSKSPHQALSSMLASITTPYLFKAAAPADSLSPASSSASSMTGSTSGASSPFAGSGRSSLDGGAMTSMPARSTVRIDRMMVGPKVAPPYPLGGLLKNHAITQAEDMLKGLLAAAKQLQVERGTNNVSRTSSGPMSIASSNNASECGYSSITDDSASAAASAWGRSSTSSSLGGGSEEALGDDSSSNKQRSRRRRIAWPAWLPGNRRHLRHVKSHRISLDDGHVVLVTEDV